MPMALSYQRNVLNSIIHNREFPSINSRITFQ